MALNELAQGGNVHRGTALDPGHLSPAHVQELGNGLLRQPDSFAQLREVQLLRESVCLCIYTSASRGI
jgi:hypothetical protein